ncbi:hypothetical protein AB7M49_007848 [Bradyrhizobium elkanii]
MRPATAYTNLDALKSLIPNERRFERPRDVFSDPPLIMAEGRAILAYRASEVAAIPSNLTLCSSKGLLAPLRVDAIPAARRSLDGDLRPLQEGKSARLRSTARPVAA